MRERKKHAHRIFIADIAERANNSNSAHNEYEVKELHEEKTNAGTEIKKI